MKHLLLLETPNLQLRNSSYGDTNHIRKMVSSEREKVHTWITK